MRAARRDGVEGTHYYLEQDDGSVLHVKIGRSVPDGTLLRQSGNIGIYSVGQRADYLINDLGESFDSYINEDGPFGGAESCSIEEFKYALEVACDGLGLKELNP